MFVFWLVSSRRRKEAASKKSKRIKALLPNPGKALSEPKNATLRRRFGQLDNSQRIEALFKPEMVSAGDGATKKAGALLGGRKI